jgi:hypothetical protein
MTRRDAEREQVTVRLPAELPVLNRQVSRILLAILVELTDVPDPDGPMEGGTRG